MRFIITTNPGLEGARLSRPGHFGNEPHPSIEAAEDRARQLGATEIERERGKAVRAIAR